MNVRQEIEKYAAAADKPVLLRLLQTYHWSSEWRFVAQCEFEGRYPNSHRVWRPTWTGKALYDSLVMADNAGRPDGCSDDIVLFKVRDYTTELAGRRYKDNGGHWVYYVQRGDGSRHEYQDYRVEWAQQLIGWNWLKHPDDEEDGDASD